MTILPSGFRGLLALWVVFQGAAALHAADPAPLAPTPPMGWNSFQSYGVYLYEEAAFANLEAMAAKLKAHGYTYFVIDGGWYGEYRLMLGTRYAAEKHASDVRLDANGRVQPSQCNFPNGFKRLIDRCHELGLKFGLHMMRGIPRKAVDLNLPILGTPYRAADIADTNPANLCKWCQYNYGIDMKKPGAQEYYDSLFAMFAAWGVDFVKYDDIVPFPNEVRAVALAKERCGRQMLLSLSPGDQVDPEHLAVFQQANMLRVTHDIWDDQRGIDSCFTAWRKWQGKERPGFWIDMDMIAFGELQIMNPAFTEKPGGASANDVRLAGQGRHRWAELTKPQMLTFITLRALSASPLMMGGNLPNLDEFSLQLLTNRDMLACNQNGVMGTLMRDQASVEIWRTGQRGSTTLGWAGVFNRTDKEAKIELSPQMLGLPASSRIQIRDVWNEKSLVLDQAKPMPALLPPHGAIFLRYSSDATTAP